MLLVSTLALGLVACGPDSAAETRQPTAGSEGLVIVPEGAPRPYFFDFGQRLWGEQIEHVYEIENREGRTVVVHDLLPDCGCTRPRATVVLADGTRIDGALDTRDMNLEVPAGAKLEVRIGIDTTRVEKPNQNKLAQVRMRSDSESTPYMTFELHVLVVRAFRAVPAEALLKDVPQSAGKAVRIDISTEIANDKSRIREIDSIDGPFTAELTEAQVSGETVWVLVVRADPGLDLGPHTGKVHFTTTRADGTTEGQQFQVPIRAQVVTDCIVEPRVLTLSRGDGVATVLLMALVPGARVQVNSARVEGGASDVLHAEWEPVDADDSGRASRWRLRLSPRGELPPDGFSGKLVIELDDPLLPRLEVPYAAPPR